MGLNVNGPGEDSIGHAEGGPGRPAGEDPGRTAGPGGRPRPGPERPRRVCGTPTHFANGAGHATVAGACVHYDTDCFESVVQVHGAGEPVTASAWSACCES
jgi:hypothetical protein